jgi:hypothetical protein
MKKQIAHIIIILFVGFLQFSCNKKVKVEAKKETVSLKETTIYDWVDLDLSTLKVNLPIIVKAPKGYELDEPFDHNIYIIQTDFFMNYCISDINWNDYENSVEKFIKKVKENREHNSLFKFEKYIVDTPNSFIAKTSAGYMVLRVIKIKQKQYCFEQLTMYPSDTDAKAKELYKMMGMTKAK